jgi:hypothetical protein
MNEIKIQSPQRKRPQQKKKKSPQRKRPQQRKSTTELRQTVSSLNP